MLRAFASSSKVLRVRRLRAVVAKDSKAASATRPTQPMPPTCAVRLMSRLAEKAVEQARSELVAD